MMNQPLKTDTSAQAATQAITTHFPSVAVASLTPITAHGLSNTKYKADLQDGTSWLIRLNERPSVLGRFEKAAFCSKFLAERGVLVPEVKAVGTLESRTPYSIERWIHGGGVACTVTDLSKRCAIWHELGAAVSQWSRFEVPESARSHCFGYDGESATRSWENHVATLKPAILSAEYEGLTSAKKLKLISFLERLPLEKYPPRLSHGDLKLDNVLVDQASGKLRAIIDWELARIVPMPLGELSTSFEPAVLKIKDTAIASKPEEREAFLKGLGTTTGSLIHDFLLTYAGDCFMNLRWYSDTIKAGTRSDLESLKERQRRYMAGISQDLSKAVALL